MCGLCVYWGHMCVVYVCGCGVGAGREEQEVAPVLPGHGQTAAQTGQPTELEKHGDLDLQWGSGTAGAVGRRLSPGSRLEDI